MQGRAAANAEIYAAPPMGMRSGQRAGRERSQMRARAAAALLCLLHTAFDAAQAHTLDCSIPDQSRGFRPGACDCFCEAGARLDPSAPLQLFGSEEGTCASELGAASLSGDSCEQKRASAQEQVDLTQVRNACCQPAEDAGNPLDVESFCRLSTRGACDLPGLVRALDDLMKSEASGAPVEEFLLSRLDRDAFCRCQRMTKMLGSRKVESLSVSGECIGEAAFNCPALRREHTCAGDLIASQRVSASSSSTAGCHDWCEQAAGAATTTCCAVEMPGDGAQLTCSLHAGDSMERGDAGGAACLVQGPRMGDAVYAPQGEYVACSSLTAEVGCRQAEILTGGRCSWEQGRCVGLSPTLFRLYACVTGLLGPEVDTRPTASSIAAMCPGDYARCTATDGCIAEMNELLQQSQQAGDQDEPQGGRWGMGPEGEPRNGTMINGSMTYDDLVEMCPAEMAACASAGPSPALAEGCLASSETTQCTLQPTTAGVCERQEGDGECTYVPAGGGFDEGCVGSGQPPPVCMLVVTGVAGDCVLDSDSGSCEYVPGRPSMTCSSEVEFALASASNGDSSSEDDDDGPPIGGAAFTAIVECVEASMWNMTNFTDPCMVCMMGCGTPQPDMTCMAQCTAGPCRDMFPEAEPSGGCEEGQVLCPESSPNPGQCMQSFSECMVGGGGMGGG